MREKGVQFFKFQQTLQQHLCAYLALLIFMLVLGITSTANAYLQISVNGDPDPVDSEIFLAPSDELILDIHAVGGDTGIDWPMGIGYFALITPISLGTIYDIDAFPIIPPAPDDTMLMGSAGPGGNNVGGMPPGYDGIVFMIGSFTESPPYPDGVYLDNIIFHCEGIGDADILLLQVDQLSWSCTFPPKDTVIVHQIPEPTTILLLGLGGLALLRRKC